MHVYTGPITNLYQGSVFCGTNKLLSNKQSVNESIEIINFYDISIGESFMSLSYHFRISDNTIGIIVDNVCKAIYKILQPFHLKVCLLTVFMTLVQRCLILRLIWQLTYSKCN